MAEFQVEIGFSLAEENGRDIDRDTDVLESFGQELEVIAGNAGPATALVGARYTALMTIEAQTPFEAGTRAAEFVAEAMMRALAVHSHEFSGELFGRQFRQVTTSAELTVA